MSRSTNGGTAWQLSSTPGSAVIGGQPVTQPNGRVVVPISDAFSNNVESFVSNDGGATYTGPTVIASITAHGAPGIRDGSGLVSAEVDGAGKVFVAWNDCRFRSGCSGDDIVYSTSTNGTTWSAVTRIPITGTSSTVEAFLPGMGVDHSTSGASAHLGVTFYFLPNATCNVNTCKINGGFISSTNGGSTWGAPVKLFGPIVEQALPNAGGYFLGDYISTSFGSNGKAYPVVAFATGSSCTLGQITSCHEFLVAPTNGLAATGGTRPSQTKGAGTPSGGGTIRSRTAF